MMWEAIGWMATGAVLCMGIQVLWKYWLRWSSRGKPRGTLN